MVKAGKRPRDPEATRLDILKASCSLFARNGANAISISAVAQKAAVNRGTVYQHFASRELLVKATLDSISSRMYEAAFGDVAGEGERKIEEVDIGLTMHRLAVFAMDNAELSRGWLLQILASPEPTADPFWREFEGSLQRFSRTKLAQENIDSQALSVIVLSSIFLWPVWAQSQSKNKAERRKLATRMSREVLRLSLFGSMVPDEFPGVVARLRAPVMQDDMVEIASPR